MKTVRVVTVTEWKYVQGIGPMADTHEVTVELDVDLDAMAQMMAGRAWHAKSKTATLADRKITATVRPTLPADREVQS